MESRLTLLAPDPRLRAVVRRYADFSQCADGPVQTQETPIAGLVVLIDLGAGWTVEGKRFGSFAAGLSDGPTTVGHEGSACAVEVDLSPLGARALLGLPAGELGGLTVELADLLGPEADRLSEHLHAAADARARARVLDAALGRRLERVSGSDPASVPPDVVRAWHLLEGSGGRLGVEALAAELRCSRRHLSRRFAAEIGLGPKAVGRILRFERAQALWSSAPLAAVAARAGYADQAHLSRDVRALTGRSPAALRAERGAAWPVPKVQDAEPVRA